MKYLKESTVSNDKILVAEITVKFIGISERTPKTFASQYLPTSLEKSSFSDKDVFEETSGTLGYSANSL